MNICIFSYIPKETKIKIKFNPLKPLRAPQNPVKDENSHERSQLSAQGYVNRF